MSTKRNRQERRREQQRARQHQKAEQNAPATPAAMPAGAVAGTEDKANHQDVAKPANKQNTRKCVSAWLWRKLSWLLNPSRRTLVIADIVFAGFIAAFSGAQVWYGHRQWDATEKQWSAMVSQLEIMRLEQRAWLGPVEPKIEKLTVGERLKVTLGFKNTGHTPARVFRSKACPFTVKTPEQSPSTTDLLRREIGVEKLVAECAWENIDYTVPPDGPLSIRYVEGFDVITEETMQAIKARSIKLVVIGIVEYRDVFGNDGKTRVDYEYNPTSEAWKSGAHHTIME